ncbi:MAG TPA: fluoride efflux transporter CrcB [Desulfobacterales bacterium]
MLKLLVIGCGGFIGAVLRYLVSGLVQNLSGSIRFPFGTLAVNVIGCLFIGLLVYLVETRSMLSVTVRMFVFIGLLGSFTTFSTFGNETLELLRDSKTTLALLNAGAQLFLGLAAVWLGRMIAYGIWR